MAVLNPNSRTSLGLFRAASMLKIQVFVTGPGFSGLYVDGRRAENKPMLPIVDDSEDFSKRAVVNGYTISDGSSDVFKMAAGTNVVFYLQAEDYSSIEVFASGAATCSATVTVAGQAAPTIDLEHQTSIGGPAGFESLRVLEPALPNNNPSWIEVQGGDGVGALYPRVVAGGSDANLWLNLVSKGTSGVRLWTGAVETLRLNQFGGATSRAEIAGGTSSVTYSAAGAPTDVGVNISTKGAGAVDILTNGNVRQASFAHTVGSVNYVNITGGPTGSSPAISARGTDANVPLIQSSKGTSGFGFYTNTFANLQFSIAHAANAVNILQATGAATATRPLLSAQGSDANIGVNISSKGTGDILFTGNNAGQTLFRIAGGTSFVNYLQVGATAAGGAPAIQAQGADTDIGVSITSKGAGSLYLSTNSFTQQAEVVDVPSAVNRWQLRGAPSGSGVSLTAAGTDTNIGVNINAKGTGSMFFSTAGGTKPAFAANPGGASDVNYPQTTAAPTGAVVVFGAAGADADVNVRMQPKGNGQLIMFGAGSERMRINTSGELVAAANTVVFVNAQGHLGLRSYTVATLPSASANTRTMIYVSDGTSNKRLAVSDGTNWRWPDGAIVS